MNTDVVRPAAQIPLNRVKKLLYPELIICRLCDGLLVDPVACSKCETAFCSACIELFNRTRSTPTCPLGCPSYTERSCPKASRCILATLTLSCRYEPNGCLDELPYQDLKAHEKECVYQLSTCIGCEEEIIQKNFIEHQNQCELVSIRCEQCSTSFRRGDAQLHTVHECLRVQLEQQRAQMNQLLSRDREQQVKIDSMEQQLQRYERIWMGFRDTTNQIRDMFDEPIECAHNGHTLLS